MSKTKKITAIVFAAVFAFLSILMIFWYFGESYGDFYTIASKEFSIPGLNDGFTPQGLCYEEKHDIFLASGYMNNGSASRIYVIDATTYKTEKYFTLTDYDGSDYTGHAGGIATNGENVWVCGDGNVLRFDFFKIENAENGSAVEILDTFDSPNGADFVTIEENYIWIGEFHKDGDYDTNSTHHITTANRKTNKALSFCYEINTGNQYGLASTTPIKLLSTPSLVQGMEILNGKIVLSSSYSLAKSNISIYENILAVNAQKTFSYQGFDIPLYVLEDKNLTKNIEAPCMSEEIAHVNGRIYVLFESACQKYGFVTRESLRNVYSFKI